MGASKSARIAGNGVAGNPAKSTAEKGERLFDVSATALAALITDAQTWAAPNDLRTVTVAGVAFNED